MAQKRLYSPGELEPVMFLRDSERSITGHQLLERAPELKAVTGKEQLEFIWDRRSSIQEKWKAWGFRGLLVPDVNLVYILRWSYLFTLRRSNFKDKLPIKI